MYINICRAILYESGSMSRLNSGIRNRHKCFLRTIFLFLKIETDSVNHAHPDDIESFVQFPGNPILKILLNFCNCVG